MCWGRAFLLEKCCSYKFYLFQSLQNGNHSITATSKQRHRWETLMIIHWRESLNKISKGQAKPIPNSYLCTNGEKNCLKVCKTKSHSPNPGCKGILKVKCTKFDVRLCLTKNLQLSQKLWRVNSLIKTALNCKFRVFFFRRFIKIHWPQPPLRPAFNKFMIIIF